MLAAAIAAAPVPPNPMNPWKKDPGMVKLVKNPRSVEYLRKAFHELAKFPKAEKDIVFPESNIWVKKRRTVYAKDFGWNAEDATACLQKAFDSGAGTVIVDNMGSPWYVRTLTPGSDKTIVFEKGVQILCEKRSAEKNEKIPMFNLKGCRDLYIEGKGDVYIGKYASKEERAKYVKDYGGSGFVLDDTHNVMLKNFTVAECGEDGIHFSGLGVITSEIYIEDVTIRHCTRQAMSICNGDGIYMKRVRFLDTVGKAPSAGIDFEPSIQEVQATANVYLFDCEFDNNLGGNIVFSESSFAPVTVYAKRCKFGPLQWTACVSIEALYGLYQGNGTDAPSDIIFEDCEFVSHPWRAAVQIGNCNVFHVTLRNCTIEQSKVNGNAGSPIRFHLGREYYYGSDGKPSKYQKEGSLWFDNVKITGYKGAEPLGFIDKTGHYSVNKVGGSVTMNGKKYDMAKFTYTAPDLAKADIAEVKAAALVWPKDRKPGAPGKLSVRFHQKGAWYESKPEYVAIKYVGQKFVVTRLGKDATEPDPDAFAIQCVSPNPMYKLEGQGSTVYFEVPPGKGDAEVKVVDGTVELLRGKSASVEIVSPRDYENAGAKYFKIKQGQKRTIYGLRILSERATFKFFDPLSGILAGDPADVP